MKKSLTIIIVLLILITSTGFTFKHTSSTTQIARLSPLATNTSLCQFGSQPDGPKLPPQVYLPLILSSPEMPENTSAQIQTSDTTNLISNGTFENGSLSGWNSGGATASTAEAHTGSWSAHMANQDMETVVNTTPGQTYKIMGWVKIVDETGNDWGGFRLEAIDWNWKSLAHSGYLSGSIYGHDWFKVVVSFTATTNQTRIKIGFFGGTSQSIVVHADDISVFQKGINQPPVISAATVTPVSFSNLPQTQTYTLVADDPDGAIVDILWDFGDGTRSLSPSGTRRVALPGSYIATVQIADDDGAITSQPLNWSGIDADFPTLAVTTPSTTGLIVQTPTVALTGTTTGDVTKVQVSTDRGYAATATGTANWQAAIPLQPGANRIIIQAHHTNENIATAERVVCYHPSEALQILNITENTTTVERWDLLEINYEVKNSAATHPQFPYEAALPPGLTWLDGSTVEAYFSPDNWQTVYKRPAFLRQPHQREESNNRNRLYPVGEPVWTVRFAPPETGTWQYYLQIEEAKGTTQSAPRTFTVVAPTNSNNHGPIGVAAADPRYFEFADGTPFLGAGHGIGFDGDGDAIDTFNEIGDGNQNFFRWWISGQIWGSAWQPWRSRTLGYDATVPKTGLAVERAYGHGLAALQLDAQNPLMFQGFAESGFDHLVPGRTYRAIVRLRTENVTGPALPGKPYGATLKISDWPEVGNTHNIPAVTPHVHGDTPWHVVYSDFVAGTSYTPYVSMILENTTGGAAYIDEIGIYEFQTDGTLGPQILRTPRFNSHLTFDQHRGAGMDTIFDEATQRGLYFKLVISEKQEYLLNHLAPSGLPDPYGNHFNAGSGSPNQQLHEYYWRHLSARFGAFRAIHSWELANESAPGPGTHFELTANLARNAANDGNPHLATTSTWATLAENAWKDPAYASIPYTDFHAYVYGTGWIEPKNELANDSARFFHEYDLAALSAGFGKPVVWGEQGIDDGTSTDNQEPLLAQDQNGVWLHKLTWARTGPGGVYPLYWYTNHIFDKSLHPIYGAWNNFMAGIPLTNGSYQDIAAASSNPNLRVLGQKDLQTGWAHFWIDNRQHTWRAIVNGSPISTASGIINIPMQQANRSFTLTWYNTATGQPLSNETISTDSSGDLTLTISNLNTDIAVRIVPQ